MPGQINAIIGWWIESEISGYLKKTWKPDGAKVNGLAYPKKQRRKKNKVNHLYFTFIT